MYRKAKQLSAMMASIAEACGMVPASNTEETPHE